MLKSIVEDLKVYSHKGVESVLTSNGEFESLLTSNRLNLKVYSHRGAERLRR